MVVTTPGQSHPILTGVSSFKGPTSCASFTYSNATAILAKSAIGQALVLAKTFTINGVSVRRADLNFFPFSSTANSANWDATTDGYKLMARALLWAGKAIN